jgi:hypothetical protein
MARIGFAVAIAAATSILAATAAQADTRFGVVCLTNKTSANIGFSFRVGTKGQWESRHLGPGQARVFRHKFDRPNENKAPNIELRYDSDVRSNKNYSSTSTLTRYAAVGDTCKEGKQYEFQHEPANRNFIRVVPVN